MRIQTVNPTHLKREIRTWDAVEASLEQGVHSKQFFFAWQEGCLMGTYNSLEDAADLSLEDKFNKGSRIDFANGLAHGTRKQMS